MHNFTRYANDVDNSVDIGRRKCVRMCVGVRTDGCADTCANAYVDKRARGVQISMWGSAGFFGAENLSTQTNVGKEVQVTYDLDTISSYGNFNWHLRTEGKSAIIDPVKHIRKMRAAAAVLKEMGDQK